MIRPYKVIKIFVQMQASSFLFFSFFGGFEGQFCKADSNCWWLRRFKMMQVEICVYDIIYDVSGGLSFCFLPQFRSIIPCEVLLYIEVTFLDLSIDMGIFWGSWFLHRHKIPHQTNGEVWKTTKMMFIQGRPQSSSFYLYIGSERSAFQCAPILLARWQNVG